jgi:mRNA-degrading endonuclease RelE of RelBE toxin-antitoxin system
MKNIPVKYHPAVRKLIKKAREDERKQIKEIITKRSFTQKIGGRDYQVIDVKEL